MIGKVNAEMGRRGDAEGVAEEVVGAVTVLVERASRVSTWTTEVRLRLMLMAAGLPLVTGGLLIYWLWLFSRQLPTYVVVGALFIVWLSCLSDGCVALCCYSPRLGRNYWVIRGLQLGVGIWAPLAFVLFFATGMASVFSALFLATGIFLLCKILVPSGVRDGRFSILQIMWMTTWIAVVFAIIAAISRVLGDGWLTINGTGAVLAAGTPGVTMMALATMLADLVEDIEADKKRGERQIAEATADAMK